jgi:hypothetical protein
LEWDAIIFPQMRYPYGHDFTKKEMSGKKPFLLNFDFASVTDLENWLEQQNIENP